MPPDGVSAPLGIGLFLGHSETNHHRFFRRLTAYEFSVVRCNEGLGDPPPALDAAGEEGHGLEEQDE